jgi:hypothetical protein
VSNDVIELALIECFKLIKCANEEYDYYYYDYLDLVFILLDRPDESHDKLISEHIMNNRSSHQMNSRDDTIMGQPNIKSEDGNDVSKRMRRSINGIYGSCINDSMDGMGGMRGIRAGSIIDAVCMIFSLI